MPVDAQAGGLEEVDLLARFGKRNERIQRPVRKQHSLLPGHRRQLPDQRFRLMYITADAHHSGEAVWIAKPNVDRHDAALGKAEEHHLFRGPALGALPVEQFKKQLAAALDAGGWVSGEIV